MNRKLRVLMLSLFAVLFAAASAFAITASDLSVVSSTDITPQTTEGYNYRQVVYLDTSTLDTSIDVVSWEVYPSGDINWLTWTLGSLDVVVEGRLPAYDSTSDNSYTLHVIAHVSGDVESGDSTISGDISADCDYNNGLVITVAQLTNPVVVSEDLVSIDFSGAERGSYDVTKDYSVTLTFLTTETSDDSSEYIKFNARLVNDSSDTSGYSIASINLPSWLAYEVSSSDYEWTSSDVDTGWVSGDYVYVTTLRVFYSADTEPAEGAPASVRIPVQLSDDSTLVDIGWDVAYYKIPAISLDVAESYDITATYGESTSFDIYFHYQEPKSIDISPDDSSDVEISTAWTVSNTSTDQEYGYITFTVNPVAPLITTYSRDVTVTDTEGNTASFVLYIDVVMDSMEISPASPSLSVDVGQTKQLTLTAKNFNGKVVSWDLSTSISNGISVVIASSDSTDYNANVVLDVTGNTPGTYSFDLTATDESSRSADVVITVEVGRAAPQPGLKVSPVSQSVTVKAGGDIVNVTFTANEKSGDVSWSFGTLPAGVTMVEANTSGDTVTYGVRASADAPATAGTNVTITASDDVKTATATLTIIVSSDAVPPASLTISPSAPSVSVAVGATANVSLTASNNSGLVTWTAGTPSGGFTIAPATDTSYATENMTTMIYTVTGVTAGSYSVKVTATDAGGNTAEATISVTVTGGGTTPKYVDPTPSVAITEALASAVKDALAALLGIDLSGYSVVALPASAFVNGSAVTFVGTNAVQLPAIKVSEDNIYMFGVPLDNLTAGATMIWEVVVSNAANDEILEASAAEDDAVFIDNNSNIVTTVPSDKYVNVAAYFEAGKTYSPTIRTTTTDTRDAGVGSASSGCSAGFGAMVSALAAAFFISRKRS